MTNLLSIQEAAKVLGVAVRTLRHYKYVGTGPAWTKIGGRVMYDPRNLEAYIKRNTQNPEDIGRRRVA